MVPNASSQRIQLIAQFFMLLWVHDDVVEYSTEETVSTVTDDITKILLQVARREISPPEEGVCAALHLTPEILTDSQGLLCDVIEKFASFVLFTRKQHRTEFNGLRDFMDYRAIDIAADFISICVRFGNALELTAEEIRPLHKVIDEATDHMVLINDLFSYDKEKHASLVQNATITNSVDYLEKALSLSPPLTKNIAMLLALDYESKLQDSLQRLEEMPGLTEAQLRYAQGMVESAAGNLLFSLTSARYGKGHGMVDVSHYGKLPLQALQWPVLGIATIGSIFWGIGRLLL
ncbi:terpene synthase family protein [Aspergillus melleus]|uniref:terpene synthase family protein n=1 Tax=Aspergillus melleus TaxID=138277 RepID=UPI001E8E46E6|nr:uncharacterized protein LDX57_000177 [Aspergillus melleus]KAH8422423.1 hypothetical protein LDX57_000177 [Aspergillus melleus]